MGETGGMIVVMIAIAIIGKNAFLDQPPFGHGIDLDQSVRGELVRAGKVGGAQVAVINAITHTGAHSGAASGRAEGVAFQNGAALGRAAEVAEVLNARSFEFAESGDGDYAQILGGAGGAGCNCLTIEGGEDEWAGCLFTPTGHNVMCVMGNDQPVGEEQIGGGILERVPAINAGQYFQTPGDVAVDNDRIFEAVNGLDIIAAIVAIQRQTAPGIIDNGNIDRTFFN